MKKHYLYTLLSLATLSLYSSYTLAACVQNPSMMNIQSNVTAAKYYIQYDDKSVKTLGTITVRWTNDYTKPFTPGSECGTNKLYGNIVNGWRPNANKVAATNIPGIGIKVATAGIGDFNAIWHEAVGAIGSGNWTVTIMKTANVTTSNSLSPGRLAQLTLVNPAPHNSTFLLTTLNLPVNAIKIEVLKCSIKQPSYSINLGDWYNTQFKNIGDISDPVDIPVTLGCMQGTNIKVNVTSSSIADAATGKINPTGANSAKGVAIQLLDKNSNPIKLNTSIPLATGVAAGDYIFGWKAQYIKIANEITPGPANATATINILYQ